MHIFSLPGKSPGRIHMTAVLVLTLALAGCATVPPPDDSMNMAQTQLQMARDAGAADYAPVDLGFAQDKFQQAQGAMVARKYADAASLAEESRADAELAQAKARLGAARAQIQNKVSENDRLRQQGEQQEATPEQQPAPMQPDPMQPAPMQPAPMQPAPEEPPVGEMPPPTSSSLATPPGDGFQTVPDTTQQPAQGGQP